jgi:hypothetical protein
MTTTSLRTPGSGTTAGDRARASAVLLAAAAQVLAPALAPRLPGADGIGAVADRYDSPLQPATYAFTIWVLIFAATTAVAVYQAMPEQRSRPVHRRTGWLLAGAFTANAVWETVYSTGEVLVLAQVAIVAIVVPLAVAHSRLQDLPVGRLERLLLRPTVALYLGWVTVATVANAGSTGVYLGAEPGGGVLDLLAAAALVLAGTVVSAVVWRSRAAAGPLAAASAWALAGIVPTDRAAVVAWAAAAAAGLVLATLAARVARGPRWAEVALG